MPRKKKSSPTPKPLPSGYQDVSLTTKHCINGIVYGPGRVRVRQDIAQGLLESERNRRVHEEYIESQRSGIIVPHRPIIPVPNSHFDAAWTNPTTPGIQITPDSWR